MISSGDHFVGGIPWYFRLDVAIVSPDLFDVAWVSMVKWGHPRRHTLPAPELDWRRERQTEVFRYQSEGLRRLY